MLSLLKAIPKNIKLDSIFIHMEQNDLYNFMKTNYNTDYSLLLSKK